MVFYNNKKSNWQVIKTSFTCYWSHSCGIILLSLEVHRNFLNLNYILLTKKILKIISKFGMNLLQPKCTLYASICSDILRPQNLEFIFHFWWIQILWQNSLYVFWIVITCPSTHLPLSGQNSDKFMDQMASAHILLSCLC